MSLARLCVCVNIIFSYVYVHVRVCPVIYYTSAVMCVCGDSALWFLKTFVRHPCPVLCPRICVCVSCSIWKTNGPKTPETGKNGQDAHADNSILYPYPRVYHTHTCTFYILEYFCRVYWTAMYIYIYMYF